MKHRYRGVRVVALAALVAGVLAVPSALAEQSQAPAATSNVVPGGYVVQLTEAPVVMYDGGIPGLQATKPAKGEKIDPQSGKVKNYVSHLNSRHNAVLGQAGGGEKIYDYVYAYNGFAAKLSAAQAEKLEKTSGVKSVEPIMQWSPDTSDTPDFLNIDGPGELWADLGGPGATGEEGAGENLVVGSVDTGIWPEHPSVDDRIGNKKVYNNIPGWHGHCVSAEVVTDGSWDANLCNQKLIGAQFYDDTAEAFGFPFAPNEFRSPRDSDGHGTHTATTAAGNNNIAPTGAAAGFGPISGMAPRARISTYKVCWDDGDPLTGGCFTTDSAAAIDQAVADGVDAINFSISGTTNSFLNVVEVAAFNAAAAGVFVAMSAGNTGPGASTVNHPSPWLTTVGASTHDRRALGMVTLGPPSGAVFSGPSQTTATVNAPLINAQDAGLPGVNANLLRQCFSQFDPGGSGAPVLDPTKVAGKIVVCERGGAAPNNARVDKSRAVMTAGGVGVVLVNVAATGSLNADLHWIPTVHLASTAQAPVQAYAATPGATATIAKDTTSPFSAPTMAAFSSRGPSLGTGDQLKPDLTAPGVDVLAGYSPASLVVPGRSFEIVSGTSMSSPHVAGLSLLLKDAHPSWSPAMIKSALMTTADNTVDTNSPPTAAQLFAQGAGHVDPTPAADPGLVYDNGPVDWLRFICGVGQLPASDCAPFGGPIDPSDLNLASIAIGDLAGTQTVARTVKSVATNSQEYDVTFEGLPGITASASPNNFTVGAGGTQAINITFTRTTAALNTYQAGFMKVESDDYVVRSPIVIRPVPLAAPAQVSGTGGAINYDVKFGYTGAFTATPRGLVPAAVAADTVGDDPTDGACSPASPNADVIPVVIPAGSTYARYQLFDADVNPGTDLDMCVFQGASLVGISAGPTSAETVNFAFANPTAGAIPLTLVVQGFAVVGTSPYKLHTWYLGTANAGNMTVTAPASATTGTTGSIGLTFSALAAATKYLGSVAYSGAAGMPLPTIVRVDTP